MFGLGLALLSNVALALGLCGAASAALAADMRVDVTGTNIKRIDGETGQPLQVITREEIATTGATTDPEPCPWPRRRAARRGRPIPSALLQTTATETPGRRLR